MAPALGMESSAFDCQHCEDRIGGLRGDRPRQRQAIAVRPPASTAVSRAASVSGTALPVISQSAWKTEQQL